MSTLSRWLKAGLFPILVSSLAVRFGRIPKREKQRLLDEMRSYMNSLNESTAMDMNSPPVRETPGSPEDGHSKEAIGAIATAYCDIFTSSSSHETEAKTASISTNNNASPFSRDASFTQVSTHPTSTLSYQSCPVAPATLGPVGPIDNQPTFLNVDDNCYGYLVSANQNYDQSNSTTSQKGHSANHNSFCNAGSSQNQPTCPWKLASGAKVLVSAGSKLKQIKTWWHILSDKQLMILSVSFLFP